MYRSHSAFDAHCRPDNVATALIRRICKVQLAFRLDKRPGESHMALDGKKKFRSPHVRNMRCLQRQFVLMFVDLLSAFWPLMFWKKRLSEIKPD